MAAQEFVYDSANEALVLRAAIALSSADGDEARAAFRGLVHSIGADEFLVGENSAIWRVLRQISDSALSYSPATSRLLLAKEATPVSEAYLLELEETAGVAENLDWHVQTLRWDATRARVMQGALNELVADLKDPRVTPEKALGSARSVARALEGGAGRRFIHRAEENFSVYRTELAKRREIQGCWPCGFEAVDRRLTEGFLPGNTAVITGLSGSGKSTFAARLAINFAKAGRRPLMCVWEMGRVSTFDLLTSILTEIPLDTVVQGTYTDPELDRIHRAANWMTKRIKFMENAFFAEVRDEKKRYRSNSRNIDILEGYIAESGCDEIIMDLWDRILADQSPDAVTDALYRQQAMHREYNVHGTLLVQLRLKDVEKRADKRPTRESIKGVGTFVEVPDLILGVHRDAQFKDVPDDTLELICLKQRKGKANWAVRFGWDGPTCQIIGGEEVSYNPGLEASSEFDGDVAEPSAIRTRPRRDRANGRAAINRRD